MQVNRELCVAWAGLALFFLPAESMRTLDSSVEYLASGSVDVLSAWARIDVPVRDGLSLAIRTEGLRNQLTYRPNAPIDPFGAETEHEETMKGAQVRIQFQQSRTEWTAVASLYDGFRNYSSIWINEYYRQQYGNGGLPGVAYRKPSPEGSGLDLSWRRELIPGTGFLSLSLGFLNDEVAPGYEVEDSGNAFELIRGESELETLTGSIAWEGILNRNMRTRHAVRLTDTTDRDLRWSWSGELNWMLSDNWIMRSAATYTREDPTFEAWSASETLEFSINNQWAMSLTYRYYDDTGQIESANLISSAAPALTSHHGMLSLRYENESGTTSFAVGAGPYWTRYEKTGIGTERFEYLYSDRDWWWTRLAVRHEF